MFKEPATQAFDESKADGRETGVSFEQGTIQSVPGQIGGAAKFDGQSTLKAGQYANFSSNDRFTLATWVYPESEQGGVIIARAEDTASQTGRSPGAKLGIGFGRTVYCQGKLTADDYGRDHHPRCFTIWLAGGGVKPGLSIGETDDFSALKQ